MARKCEQCDEPADSGRLCKVCGTIAYLIFRHAMDWPLDEADKKRLGLA